MKTRWISILTILVMAFALPMTSFAEDASGLMMVVKGDIKVTTKAGKTEAAKVGRKVVAGDTILAGADSRAKIVMSDKNVINISPDSKIIIEKYENDGKKKNVELNVLYGKVRASVEQKYDGDKSKFNIKTPSAVAGVRGTDFITGYNAQTRVAQIITFSGTVAVGQPGPGGTIKNPVFVQPGQMTQAGLGQTPEAPKSVPKEDLNKMNSESKADTAASNGDAQKSDGKEAKKDDGKDKDSADDKQDADKQDADKKEGEKKEADKKDSDKQDADKKDGDKKSADKKDSDKQDAEKKDGDKKSADKKDANKDDKGSAPDKKDVAAKDDKGSGDKKDSGSKSTSADTKGGGDGSRAPASTDAAGGAPARGPSMVDSKDLGPALSNNLNMPPPPVGPSFNPVTAPVVAPTPNPFLGDAIRNNMKTKTTIILAPQ
ncbi:MAG: hypothetical protein COT73_03845 [Bdellovibrio sp. CG10_big_fil_rev_8_21_14_0_10_47_8]|nr:MAG: hypothetical protein COT73_03845 [Bdellovibrio sp. CG10_big_fil_rev_8_21_14_0_10_47_8]